MKRKLLKTLIAVILIGAAALYTVSFIAINNKYPNPPEIKYNLGDEITFHGLTIKATGYELLNGDNIIKRIPSFHTPNGNDGKNLNPNQYRALLAKVQIKNATSSDNQIPLYTFAPESGVWSNGLDPELFMALNRDTPIKLSLAPGEEKSVVLPYTLYDFQINPHEWSHIDTEKFQLVLSLYPQKVILLLS